MSVEQKAASDPALVSKIVSVIDQDQSNRLSWRAAADQLGIAGAGSYEQVTKDAMDQAYRDKVLALFTEQFQKL